MYIMSSTAIKLLSTLLYRDVVAYIDGQYSKDIIAPSKRKGGEK